MATNITRPYSMDNFFNVVTDPNGKNILDPYTFLWTELPYFLRNSQGLALRIDASLEGVPDLISWNTYETHDYWWVVCIANEMVTPDTEIIPGITMFIPNASDVSNFNSQVTIRQRQQGRLVSLRPAVRSGQGSEISLLPPPTTPVPSPTGKFILGQSLLGGPDVLG